MEIFITRDISYIEFMVYDTTWKVQYFTGGYNKVNNGAWHSIALVENFGVNGLLYIDGVYYNVSSTTFTNLDNTFPLNIGLSDYNGCIDDVRIYDAAPSSSQIKQNYITGLDSLLSKNLISKEEYNQNLSKLSSD